MEDFIFAVQQFEQFPVMLAMLFAAIVYAFVRPQSGALALFSIPVVIAGSLTSHYLFTVNSIILVKDKDTNTASGVAIGMLFSVVVVMAIYVLSMVLSERRSAAKKLKPLTGVQRAQH